MTSSPHFDDHEPELVAAESDYPGQVTGPGRWAVLALGGDVFGVLWTNDDDGLGILPVNDAGDDAYQAALILGAAITSAAARGASATDAFVAVQIVADSAGIAVSDVTEGDLAAMAAAVLR